jgi:F-box-like
MKKGRQVAEDSDSEPLIDETGTLSLHSKKTNRQQKKQQRKKYMLQNGRFSGNLLDLPPELLLDILSYLQPSTIFTASRTSRAFRKVISSSEKALAKRIIDYRYPILSQCFRLPILLSTIDPSLHAALRDPARQELMALHRKPYQHVPSPDPELVCTCLTCMLRWNALCLAVDFNRWQSNLEAGEPIPMIPRGKHPQWNRDLLSQHRRVVENALQSPLWYAAILQAHLDSTIRSIQRHSANKGNKRRRFLMTPMDAGSRTDCFLHRSGPPSLDFPFHRDNYYMLEAYLPNRGWFGEKKTWVYVPEDQHDIDLGFVARWAKRRNVGAVLREKGVGEWAKPLVADEGQRRVIGESVEEDKHISMALGDVGRGQEGRENQITEALSLFGAT